MDSRLKENFTNVYMNHTWGSDGTDALYSGPGSHEKYIVDPYIRFVSGFLRWLPKSPICVDLGCGDFSIGSRLVSSCEKYIACDIVDEVINQNKLRYPDIDFHVLDATSDELPSGNVVILRQVLQHLSDSNIKKVLAKISGSYKYLILTEHMGRHDGARSHDNGSGVDIFKAPFSFPSFIVGAFPVQCKEGGVIQTTIYETGGL